MSIKPQNITVYEDVEEDYIVYDREINENPNPAFNHNILVTNDNKSNRLWFNMWYTFDNIELEHKTISIIWISADGTKGETAVGDIEVVDVDRLKFSWNVPGEATTTAGTIQFAVRIVSDNNNYIWNSLPGSVEVRQGLDMSE